MGGVETLRWILILGSRVIFPPRLAVPAPVGPFPFPNSMDCRHDKVVKDDNHPHSNYSAKICSERINGIRPLLIKR